MFQLFPNSETQVLMPSLQMLKHAVGPYTIFACETDDDTMMWNVKKVLFDYGHGGEVKGAKNFKGERVAIGNMLDTQSARL
jgi:hypothetical protein